MKSISSGTAPDAIPIIGQNPSVQNAKSKLAALQAEKVKLLDRYGEKHPQVVQVNTALADAQRQYDLAVGGAVQSVRNEYEAAIIEERSLSHNLEGAKAEATDLNRKGIGYGVMEREAKSNREVYQSLLTREKELRVSANSRTNNVRVIDHAEVPKAPMTPGGRRTWLISIVVGLVLSIAVALGLDYMNDTIKTPEDVTRAPETAVPRPGAVGPRRQAPAAGVVSRAARLRRIVPLAADVAARPSIRARARRSSSSPARSHSKARRRRRRTSRWRWRTAARACC